ncbi:DegT/DnrJ/EryC1/StrS aminotransferase family protein [Candidatus Pelagibacter sp.]|jgi:dTDP-4-amino-4,6-dideoxygalactose transaminase|nr:DegT/DnrJ/EryC1/StrS aminotransferase family protein [Candidatus Pelagibacter sp.]
MKNTGKQISLFKPRYRSNEVLNEIKKTLVSGWTGIGNKTVDFEREWEKYTKLKNSLFLNSATAGLHLAIEVFKDHDNWTNNSEIITTPISFVSTSHSILYANLKPVFCDIDETGTLDPHKVEKLINKNTKAVIFVGLGGTLGNLKKINKICKKKNIKLILDAAHMSGARYENRRHVGFESDISIFSFQAVKNLPSADSGVMNFKDINLYKLAKKYSWCGIDKDTFDREKRNNKQNNIWEYDVPNLGYKYNGNSVIAQIARVSLKYLEKDNNYRKKLCLMYKKNLSRNKNIFIVPHTKGSSRHLFSILIKNRSKMIQKLKENNIHPGVHYKSILEFSFYKKKKFKKSNNIDISKNFSKSILSLPLHTFLKPNDIQKICNILNAYA